jgi:uncharacterized protein involved in exopolysaccharide biosynthesis
MSNDVHDMTAPASQPGDEDEISLLDLALVVAENLKLLILGPLAIGVAALGISFAVTPTFTASTQFLPPQQAQSAAAGLLSGLGALGGLAGAAAGLKNPSDQYVAFLKSRVLEDALIDRFKLMERYESEFKQDARKTLEGNVKISAGKDGLIDVEVDDKDPQFAADLANAHVDELRTLMSRLAVTEAQQRRQFFEGLLQKTKDNLVAAEAALQASGVNPSAIKTSPAAAVEGLAKLQAEVAAQEVRIQSMRGYLAESAPEMKQALNTLAALRAQLAKIDAPATTKDKSDYVNLFREFKYHETLFELYAKQFEIARADEAREGATIQVVDVAVPPERKSKPKKALIAVLATLASGFALLLWVFIRHALKNARRDPESAEKLQTLKTLVGTAFKRS